MTSQLESYLQRLVSELRKHGVASVRVVEEAREHLVDAAEQARQRGLSIEEAEREAIERFGPPELVAETCASGKPRLRNFLWLAIQRMLAAVRADGPLPAFGGLHLHDRRSPQGALHFLARARKGHLIPELSEPDTRALLMPMLERGAGELARFGATGSIQSLDLLEEKRDSGKYSRRYRAVFANGGRVIIVHTSDRRSTSVDMTPE